MRKLRLCSTMSARHDSASPPRQIEKSGGGATLLERVLRPVEPDTAVGNPNLPLRDSRLSYDRVAFPALIGIVVYAALRNLAEAATKPLWFDELITQVMSRQPNFSALWAALKTAA